jgi:hypothetical protein
MVAEDTVVKRPEKTINKLKKPPYDEKSDDNRD